MSIDYQKFLDESMLDFVRKVLIKVQKDGLQSNHHYYISFRTNDPLVKLADKIKHRYPKEITIVLQHQFEDLAVHKDYFAVKLSFDGIKQLVEVPFRALTSFVDPEVNFNLQFKAVIDDDYKLRSLDNSSISPKKTISHSNVIQLDQFRKIKRRTK